MTQVLLGPWPLWIAIVAFAAASSVTITGSVRMAYLSDTLADRTGWGEALFGAVFFSATAALSGIVITAVTAADGHAELAYGNAVGGIAAQTLAIALVDSVYRGTNLEHAAASLSNILFGCLLVGLLTLPVMAVYIPAVVVFGVHPMSAVIVAAYLGGLVLIRRNSDRPMWEAVRTRRTEQDDPDEDDGDDDGRRDRSIWGEFAVVGGTVALGGWALATAAESIVNATGLGASFVGAVLLGLVNAIPETVTAIAAVRRGALTLAIAAILGGNCFDVLTLVVGDVAYSGGSFYHVAGADELFLTLASLLMGVVVVLGLLARQRRGPGRVGIEGVGLVSLYGAIVVILGL